MVPNACCGLNGCKILHPGLILLFLGATRLYGGVREGLNFLGACGPCVQGDVSACAGSVVDRVRTLGSLAIPRPQV